MKVMGLRGIFVFLLWATSAFAGSASDRLRERLNKLFFWQMSEELKLQPQQEKAMVTAVEEIQAKRDSAIRARDAALGQLRGKNGEQAEAELKLYQQALEQISALDVEEFKRLKDALGSANLARYFVLREQILDRVRASLLKK